MFRTIQKIALIILCLTPALSYAQPEDDPQKYEKEIQQTVIDVMHVYEQLPQIKTKDKMLDYFAPEYKVDRVRFSVSERVESKTDDKFDVEKLVTLVSETPNMKIDYNVDKFVYTYATQNVGYCMYEASYDVQKDDKPYVQGREIVTYFFQRMGGKWKIIHGHIVQVRETVSRSGCPCSVYKSEANENTYIVQTEVPEGDVFTKKLNTFKFITMTNGYRVIDVDGQKFSWDGDGMLSTLVSGPGMANKEGGKIVGTAKKQPDAVRVLLQNVIYADNCSSVNIQK